MLSNLSQVQYEVPRLVRKKETPSSQLCVKFENGFFQSCSLCPLCFSWAASPFPSNCLGKLVGHIQTIAVPGTSKFGEDHTLCSLSEFLWYQWNTDHFQSGSWGGSYDVVRFSTLLFYSLGSDSTPLFLSLEWVAMKQKAAASRKRLHLVVISVLVSTLSTESFRNLTQNQNSNLFARAPRRKGDARSRL